MTEHPVAQRSDCTAAHPAVQKKKILGVLGVGGGEIFGTKYSFHTLERTGNLEKMNKVRQTAGRRREK